MSKLELLKKLLPGFLPLFIFILADEIWGTKIGLIIAIVFGVGQLGYTYVKEKRIDRFVLLDTGLIVLLGLISIVFENDIFFKIKPAFIGFIFVGILGFSAFSKVNIMALMSQRYMKGVEMNEMQVRQMNKSIKVLFYIFLLHTILVLYSAFYMSKEAWGFISGGLFYIIFGGYFIYELIKNKIKANSIKKEEWLPIVDEEGKVLGKAPRSVCHKNKDLLHPVVHLHILNSKGELLLQKRAMNKIVQPGKWDTAVGGHVSLNETIEEALKKEAFEELGITDFKASLIKKYVWESTIEKELVFMFFTQYDGEFVINKNEIDEGRFWQIKDIDIQINENIFTPNFIQEFKFLKRIFSKK